MSQRLLFALCLLPDTTWGSLSGACLSESITPVGARKPAGLDCKERLEHAMRCVKASLLANKILAVGRCLEIPFTIIVRRSRLSNHRACSMRPSSLLKSLRGGAPASSPSFFTEMNRLFP